jgi:toxin ParE1/3/4
MAIRFREAARNTADAIRERPRAASPYRLRNAQLQGLRSWPVTGFDSIRMYFLIDEKTIRVIRILHGKRGVREILEQQE